MADAGADVVDLARLAPFHEEPVGHDDVFDVGEVPHRFEGADRDLLAAVALGGGVSANTHLRRVFKHGIEAERPGVALRIPTASLTTDNAIMIALAGFYRARREDFSEPAALAASGNRSLA